jgi:bifunctional UDP-N-acetylglucosamine pyrophosphorylase / glucosamine-1-phosphate N-acetyltransferase
MNAIVQETDCDVTRACVTPSQWTAIIPAAGSGSRLGHNQPKILYPLLGRPIMDWVLEALRPVCSRYVFVLSPSGAPHVEPEIVKRLGSAAKVAIQQTPTGMGDAVLCAESAVETPYSLVVWGDQITLSQTTVRRCAALHEARSGATLTFPTIMKASPYIHMVRDADGRVVEVLQAREQKIDRAMGESDCGLFLFTTVALFTTLRTARVKGLGIGRSTGEFNLLQTIPVFDASHSAVQTLRISDISETLGVNTVEDARRAEDYLRLRRHPSS